VSTAIFTGFELPVGNALGSNLLEGVLGASPGLVEIRSVEEAIVIGAGLSLSSSAFVLQVRWREKLRIGRVVGVGRKQTGSWSEA
jgi:hypothetical protein